MISVKGYENKRNRKAIHDGIEAPNDHFGPRTVVNQMNSDMLETRVPVTHLWPKDVWEEYFKRDADPKELTWGEDENGKQIQIVKRRPEDDPIVLPSRVQVLTKVRQVAVEKVKTIDDSLEHTREGQTADAWQAAKDKVALTTEAMVGDKGRMTGSLALSIGVDADEEDDSYDYNW